MLSPSPEIVLEDSLRRVEWQPVVLSETPRRLDLLSLAASWPTRELRVRVHRNTAVEYVVSLLPPFLAYAGLSATVEYSDYDDSLSTVGSGDARADVEVVWLDFERYAGTDPAKLADWLRERLAALRARTVAPVLVADWPGTSTAAAAFNRQLERWRQDVPGLAVADLSAIAERVGPGFVDLRGRDVAGTRMSAGAAVLAAQRMGLRWLPALVAPRLKALAVDLDMTLYQGVLGEDGPAGVVLTDGHRALQQRLRDLADDGVLLALVSRNEPADVEALFATRTDFPLRLQDFSARAIGWGPKSGGVAAAAGALRISPEAAVFVDDNVGELAEVAAGVPVGGLLHAADPGATATALALFPGLHGHPRTDEDALRAADLAAATERVRPSGGDRDAYLRSLRVRLRLALDDPGQVARMAALAAKTNQFNTALRRTAPAEFGSWLAGGDVHVVTAALGDRLSDSGVVAVVAGRRGAGDRLLVEELCISCRALGRDVEDVLLAAALGRLMEATGTGSAAVVYTPGPRNEPARAWLEEHSSTPVDAPGEVSLPWDPAACRALVSGSPVAVTWEGQE
ncbi:HAD-IIIC family phosphatase [Geodermatophilus sp. SYSU D00708]